MVEAKGARKKLAIIDGKSVFYRGYYAMPNLSTKDGTPTGGVFGFATMALEVIKRLKPDYVAVAWDKPKTNIRRRLALYPEYKAGRKPAPPDFYVQIPILHELLQAFGWPLYELDDYEAEDIMATLAVQATKKDIETLLITSDLDALQLVHPLVHVYAMKKGLSNIELFSPASFEAKYGIKVEQFLDLKALKGDSSDNIPGVPGIGEKTAIELLKQHKTLDGVYENLALLKDSIRAKLEAGKESAYLSKKIAAIWTDAPLKLDLEEVNGSKFNAQKAREVLEKLEFRSLARQLPEGMDFNGTHPANHMVWKPEAKTGSKVISSEEDLQDIKLGTNQLFVHVRTLGKHGRNPQTIILSPDPKTVFTIDASKIPPKVLKKALTSNLSPKTSLIGYDVKSYLEVLLELGVELPPVAHDVLIGAFLLNSLRREQSLTELARADLGYDGTNLDEIDHEETRRLGSEIMGVLRGLYDKQAKELIDAPKVAKLAEELEWPVIPVLARMEHRGIKLDTQYLKVFAVQLEDSISDLEQQIYGYADQEFNISSPSQLADILFNKLNLSKVGIKKGKTGFSTATSELDKLRGLHPIIDLISQYREVTKLKNTYVDTLPKLVDENSRVHTTYDMAVAPTGRLSSRDPNLQSIPVKTELGNNIRKAFVAEEGNVFIGADYSQFELRLAAYLCGDKNLIELFNKDTDVHLATAAQIYGREPEDVTKTMRSGAKAVNFGVMYGLSPHGLSAQTGMTHEQAKHFIDKYFEVRPNLLNYIESVREKARKDGYTETILGRRRPTPDVHSSNFVVREAAMRAAVNMPFQGSAADIMKLAMIAVDKKLANTGAKILLQIHDSILIEAPKDEAEKIAKTVKETMESVYKLPVKLTVDTSIATNWGEL